MMYTGKSWRATVLVQHRGEASMYSNTGHYVAYTREGDDWILNNDNHRSTAQDFGVSRGGYIFMDGISLIVLVKN